MTDHTTYIRLDITESAALDDVNTLLPHETIYKPLQDFIEQALKLAIAAKRTDKSLNEARSHNAVSLDGDRGTGKSSVVVNLSKYLKLQNNSELQRVHVLAPTDPTLLEDGESLFLHVIIASVLHDKDIQSAQKNNPAKCQQLNKQLEKLAHAMESIETQKDSHGIDKIRAQFSNKHLADCVHDFFKLTLELVDKDLLVMPIDDVDTSLNRAFENLEVIRRYLTTPFVLPIVTGDQALYNDVTWRDFHGRLTRDSNYERGQAAEKAKDLANEYQRKILPVPRRLRMPEVENYWATDSVKLRGADNQEIMPLQNFIAWLEIFISGPVNGLESSQMQLPIYSMRALTQLLNSCRDLIPKLPDKIKKAKNRISVKRAWHMPDVDSKSLEDFESNYLNISKDRRQKRNYGPAYRAFSTSAKIDETTGNVDAGSFDYSSVLLEYFRYEKDAGAVCLVLRAQKHWMSFRNEKPPRKSIFDTPIFQPLVHEELYSYFNMNNNLSEWESLKKYVPEKWGQLVTKKQVIIPYPVADLGVNAPSGWKYWESLLASDQTVNNESSKKAVALITLMAQLNFYGSSKRWMTLNIGRLFEIIMTSLITPASNNDIETIRQGAPFFSVNSLAPTKTINDGDDENDTSLQYQNIRTNKSDNALNINAYEALPEHLKGDIDDLFYDLEEKIDNWKRKFNIEKINISPWLAYKVFNKVYSQVATVKFSQNGLSDIESAINIAGLVFYSTWAAFGSFEKGELFGLPPLVSTVNLNNPRNFDSSNDLFNVNLRAFSLNSSELNKLEKLSTADPTFDRKNYGEKTRTVSYALASHPLRQWIDSALAISSENEIKKETQAPTRPMRSTPRLKSTVEIEKYFIEELHLKKDFSLTILNAKRELRAVDKVTRGRVRRYLSNTHPRVQLAINIIAFIDSMDGKSTS